MGPWLVREPAWNPKLLAQTESVFALTNGHLGLRGNLDEGERQLSQRRLRAAPAAGVTGRPAGGLRIGSTPLVSFTQRAVAAIDYTVEAVDSNLRITVQSGLIANEAQPQASGDPRVAAVLDRPLAAVEQDTRAARRGAAAPHRASGVLIAAGMDREITRRGDYDEEADVREGWARTTVVTVLRAGQQLHVVIYLGYGWSATARRRRSPIRPRSAADTLRWRRSALGLARRRARTLGLSGAAFPWRTIRGEECSAYWPAGAAALHLIAVVARTVDL